MHKCKKSLDTSDCSSSHRDDTDITQEIRAQCPPTGSPLPGTATVNTSLPQTLGDLQVGSDEPNPKDSVQQLQYLCGPKAGQALGQAHGGSGCSSVGACGTSCVVLRPSSSTLHQPIHAGKIPSLG